MNLNENEKFSNFVYVFVIVNRFVMYKLFVITKRIMDELVIIV